MVATRLFVLTEAAAAIPLVDPLLADVRATRCRLWFLESRLGRSRARADERDRLAVRLIDLQAEAESLGVRITPAVRCEALFPFEHQWAGPRGDGRLRRAFFVYNDVRETIDEWFFDGWPDERNPVPRRWWRDYPQTRVRARKVRLRIPRLR